MTPMSMEESNRIRKEKPNRIVRSRLHLRRKPTETPEGLEYNPKARWIIIGFEDPDVFQLEGTSPTPQLQSINIFVSIAAGLDETIYQGDLEEAFLQGKQTKREIYVEQPPEGVPGMEP